MRHEFDVITTFGKHAFFDASFVPFKLNGKQQLLVTLDDIGERKATENALFDSQEQLKDAQRIAKIGSWSLDISTNRLSWSDEVFRLFEINPDKFGASYEAFLDAIHPDDRTMVDKTYTRSLVNHQPFEITHRLLLSDGRIKYVRETCETLYDEADNPILSNGTAQDITKESMSSKEMALYASAFHNSAEAIVITDRDNKIITVNKPTSQLTGYSLSELKGKAPSIFAAGHTPQKTYDRMWDALRKEGKWQGELFDRRKNGEVYPTWTTISVVRDEGGQVANYIANFIDITDRKAADEQIHHLAHHDHLTGLNNRFSLQQRLEQAIVQARRNSSQLALMFIDMDNFKVINDTLGHQIGDALLIEVAARLGDAIRESDIVARIGGDEFVVIYTSIDSDISAAPMAAFITHTLSQPYHIEGNELHSSPSIGISIFPNDGGDAGTLMKTADTAMYHAKELGRNNYQFFTTEMNAAANERMILEQDLRSAQESKQFELYYQPKVDSINEEIIGVEALIRWNHPQQGLVAPDKFIPIAEETGLIRTLGQWVLDEACRQLAVWHEQGIVSIKMAVNLSPKQLRDPQIIKHLQECLTKHNIDAADLELEVTETAAMANAEQAIELMKQIRAVGVELAIDDFGTGYSSLAYLKLFPIQTLKLDRTFVRDIEEDENDAAICKATIALAHNMGMKVVAEGVETEAQKEFLTSHHCDILQGYLFSRPVPAGEATKLLTTPSSH